VNLAPLKEALEHVRSIFLHSGSHDWSIDHVASKSCLTNGRGWVDASIKIAIHRLLTAESVKMRRIVAWRMIITGCRGDCGEEPLPDEL
jgi:hypothetical protein